MTCKAYCENVYSEVFSSEFNRIFEDLKRGHETRLDTKIGKILAKQAKAVAKIEKAAASKRKKAVFDVGEIEEEVQSLILQLQEDTERQILEATIESDDKIASLANKEDDFRREAQKTAIRITATNAFQTYHDIEPVEIWKYVYTSHIHQYSGIDDIRVIESIVSAENSWKKSSGHAFEQMICDLTNPFLQEHGIKFILQKELSDLIALKRVTNEVRDISWIKEQTKSSVFDLYAVIPEEDDCVKIFGCIQSKTSIRDRVTRDREPSQNAMKAYFWSIAVALDGDFLRLPKFQHMVNGGSTEFEHNGWHALYYLSRQENRNGRIIADDILFTNLVRDAIKAKKSWLEQRQWFTGEWKA